MSSSLLHRAQAFLPPSGALPGTSGFWRMLVCAVVFFLQAPLLASEPLPRSTPEAQGISSTALLEIVSEADAQFDQMNSIMLLRHGCVVAEGWWSPYRSEDRHQLYSLSKSFTSTAVGLAAAEGKLDIHDLVLKHFADQASKEPSAKLSAMRVKDLLTMSTGHQTEPPMRERDAPWVQTFLNHPVEHTPGAHFLYNTPATYMQSALVQKVTGQKLVDYLQTRLFQPLGIEDPLWEESPQGISVGGSGLNVRTEDIAKFGQLYLQKGVWKGKQLVPADWIAMATSKQVSNGSDPNSDWNQGYCFQFWRCRHNCYRGDGAFGQYCIVMPDYDAVLAITSGQGNMQAPLNLVWDKLLPAMKKEPLQEQPEQHKALQEKLKSLVARKASGSPSSPHFANYAGKRFKFPPNDGHWDFVGLEGANEGAVLVLGQNGVEHKIPCGAEWKRLPGKHTLGFQTEKGMASCGAWAAPDLFHARLCFYETPFYLDIKLQFDEDGVKMAAKQNVGFGKTDFSELQGSAN